MCRLKSASQNQPTGPGRCAGPSAGPPRHTQARSRGGTRKKEQPGPEARARLVLCHVGESLPDEDGAGPDEVGDVLKGHLFSAARGTKDDSSSSSSSSKKRRRKNKASSVPSPSPFVSNFREPGEETKRHMGGALGAEGREGSPLAPFPPHRKRARMRAFPRANRTSETGPKSADPIAACEFTL